MPFDWDRTEVWIGILIGLPSFFALFLTGKQEVALLVLIATVILVYGTMILHRPEFTITELEKILVIKNKQGTQAILTRSQRAICNHKGLTEFWCGGIGSSGTIRELRIDKAKPHSIEENCKEYRICKRFHPPLVRGQRFETVVSYLLDDSFPADTESLQHSTDYLTKKLTMRVRLPASRRCRSSKAYICINGHPLNALPMPRISDDNREIVLEVVRPKKGHEYILEWVW
jgi:hypothetical protein